MKSKDKRSKSRKVKEIRKSKQEWEGDENSGYVAPLSFVISVLKPTIPLSY